jgi:ribonuclease R
MKFTVAALIDQLPAEEQLSISKLEKALGLSTKTDKEQLRIALTALVRVGVLEESDAGVGRSEDEGLIEARLRCSSKGFCFALREDGGEDIYIRDNQLNHAWNGDRVLVRITREGGRRRSPEGGVQCILERSTTSLLAQVEQQDDRLVAVPLDDRLLTSIELPATDLHYLKPADEAVVEVKVDRYPVGQLPSQGHVARSLAVNAGPEADLDLLVTKHGLRDLPAAPKASLKTPEAKDRDDLTKLPTLLLEPWSSSEAPLLPAVSLESSDNGHRLWVRQRPGSISARAGRSPLPGQQLDPATHTSPEQSRRLPSGQRRGRPLGAAGVQHRRCTAALPLLPQHDPGGCGRGCEGAAGAG